MFSEADLLSISALNHLSFCERRCALVHIEQVWEENRFTAEGRILHERVHGQESELRGDILTVRGLRIRSLVLGLSGIADVVEFHRATETGIVLPGRTGFWTVYPVEYKRGKPKRDSCDEVQLCAQAICMEEMTGASIGCGALYYGAQHKRHEVIFGSGLRESTEALSKKLHELIRRREIPKANYEKKCDSCSLFEICMPAVVGKKVAGYLDDALTAPHPLAPSSPFGDFQGSSEVRG